jgi:putative transcriptional regulator
MDLIGRILVARPIIQDPYFKKSVVLIYEQNDHTAGLVLNKPGTMTFTDVAIQKGMTCAPEGNVTIYNGGPVNQNALVVLHTNEWNSQNTLVVDNKCSVSSDGLMIHKISSGNIPNGFRVFTGASIWRKGQLEHEINLNHWLITDFSTRDIFDIDRREQWDAAVNKAAKQMIDRLFH